MCHNEYIITPPRPLPPQNLYRMKRVTHPSLQGAVLNDVIHLDAVVTDVRVSGFLHTVQHPQESPARRRVLLHILSCTQQLPDQ